MTDPTLIFSIQISFHFESTFNLRFYISDWTGALKMQESLYLINGTRNKTGDIGLSTEDLRESHTERWCRLHCWKRYLPNAVAVFKTEYPLCLVECDTFLNFAHRPVEGRGLAENNAEILASKKRKWLLSSISNIGPTLLSLSGEIMSFIVYVSVSAAVY